MGPRNLHLYEMSPVILRQVAHRPHWETLQETLAVQQVVFSQSVEGFLDQLY